MVQLSNPQEWVDKLVASAIESFQSVHAGNVDLTAVSHGLEFLCRATLSPGAIDEQSQATVRSELWRLAPTISQSVEGSISTAQVYLALGTAWAMLSSTPDNFHIERVAHASILAAQLKALVLQRLLHERGNTLLKNMIINQAWAAADHAPRVLQ